MDWSQTLLNVAGGAIGGAIVGFFAFRIGYRRGAAAMLTGIITADKITANKLAPGSVRSPILAPGSVNSPRVAPGAIGNPKIKSGADWNDRIKLN